MRAAYICGIASLISIGHASAMGLMDAYEEAYQNDPTFRSAVHERDAGEQNLAMGRSRLLPNISLSYAQNRNLLNITTTTSQQGSFSQQQVYNGKVTTLQMRQPIINLGSYAGYRQGQAQADYSDAQFSSHAQDLALRVVQAYTDVLNAADQLDLAKAQLSAYEEEMHVNEIKLQKGEGTRTDVLETQSKYALVEAQVIEAQDQLDAMKRTLSGIVGKDVGELNPLSASFKPLQLNPEDFNDWKTIAISKNQDLKSQRYAIEASRQEVNKNRAGHAPQLDLVASISRNNDGSIYTFNQDMYVRSAGIELNVPLFAGGYVNAATRQASANFERAQSDLDDKTNKLMVDLFKQYHAVRSSTARIEALEKAVEAARLLTEATRMSIKGGERINLDLLNAQAQYYQARRDLAKARYDYINSYLHLNFDAGTLDPDSLRMVAGYFIPGMSVQ